MGLAGVIKTGGRTGGVGVLGLEFSQCFGGGGGGGGGILAGGGGGILAGGGEFCSLDESDSLGEDSRLSLLNWITGDGISKGCGGGGGGGGGGAKRDGGGAV